MINSDKMLNIREVSALVDRSVDTINIWYSAKKFYEESELELRNSSSLPDMQRDSSGTPYWVSSDVPRLIYFRDSLKRGDLAEYNRAKSWGKRGKVVRERLDMRQKIEEMMNNEN